MGDFSRHRPGGGGSGFLTGWKKDPGYIETWQHTSALPMAVYRHSIPMIVVKKDKDTNTEVAHVWSKQLVCHETDDVLESQYFRERGTINRQKPPERCGLCKLIEWCYQQCAAFEETRGQKKTKGLELTTEMFKFEGDLAKETLIVHIGGVCNILGKADKHTDAQKLAIKKARIAVSESFKENFYAKLQYAMMVVDDAHPERGVRVAAEASSLGQAVQAKLEEELENGVDIQKTPYCIKWSYNEKEPDLKKKYKAIVLRNKKPTKAILDLIRGPAPEVPDDLSKPFNQQQVRAVLEEACILPKGTVPWSELFPTPEQEAAWKREDEAAAAEERAESKDAGDDASDDDDEEGDDEDPVYDEDGDEIAECNGCDKSIKVKLPECPHCGEKYEVVDEDDDEEEEEEPAKPAKKPAPAAAAAGSKKPKRATPAADEDDNQGDGIPFIVDMGIRSDRA